MIFWQQLARLQALNSKRDPKPHCDRAASNNEGVYVIIIIIIFYFLNILFIILLSDPSESEQNPASRYFLRLSMRFVQCSIGTSLQHVTRNRFVRTPHVADTDESLESSKSTVSYRLNNFRMTLFSSNHNNDFLLIN